MIHGKKDSIVSDTELSKSRKVLRHVSQRLSSDFRMGCGPTDLFINALSDASVEFFKVFCKASRSRNGVNGWHVLTVLRG